MENKKKRIDPFWLVIVFLGIVAGIFFFSKCESDEEIAVRCGRETYQKMFQQVLRDPSSLEIYDERYTVDDDGDVHWVLDVGSRNGFGGMVRKTYRLRTSRYLTDRVYNEDESDDSFNMYVIGRGVVSK